MASVAGNGTYRTPSLSSLVLKQKLAANSLKNQTMTGLFSLNATTDCNSSSGSNGSAHGMQSNGSDCGRTNTSAEEGLQPVVADYQWPVLFLFIIVIMALGGNILVCLAVRSQRKLHNMFNYFLVSLALSDMMSATLVMPLSIVKALIGK